MVNFLQKNRIYLILAIGILIIYFFRLINLTILPVFADEAIYIRWAQIMRAEETLRFLPLSDGKQPLFMWVTIPFLKIFNNPLVAARLVSVFAGMGTLLGVGFLSWVLFKNKRVSMVAAFLYAISPYTFFFDRLALSDSLLSMFGIWTFICSYKAITEKRLDFALLGGFALGGAWLTKSPALFFALLLPTLWLFTPWEKTIKSNIIIFARTATLTLITIVIGYGFYNILRLGPNFSMIASRNLDYVHPLNHFLVSPLDPFKPFLIQAFQWISSMGPWPLIFLGLLGTFINFRKYLKQITVILLWFIVPIFIQAEFAKVLTARYLLFTIPYLLVLSSLVFIDLKKWSKLIYVAILLLAFQSIIFNYHLLTNPAKAAIPRSERSGYLEEWTAGQGIKETGDYLRDVQLSGSGEKIVIGTEGYFGTLPDGLQIYLHKNPEITVIGVGLNFSELPKQLIESKAFGNKTFLLINNERFKGDAEKLGLKVIREFKKAQRPDGSSQTLILYELTRIQ